ALGGVDPGEVVVGVMPQPHLHAPEAARDMLACFPFQLAWVVGPEEAACVCGHLVPFCTEQLVDRLAGGFATERPQRDVEAAARGDRRPFASVPPGEAVHEVPELFDLGRVAADEVR